ncbi:type II toxin-antitoxin system Phd/YefM family antitoxin [Candidatus Berkelbacteria bacterium]|nr:type II toxin-antitoxin system Phd/YefM family antitoxin [Candidatus Berkelbacteria bacterium]
MDNNIVSARQIQRQYRKLIDEVKRTKKPVYLGSRSRPEAVLLDADVFEELWKKRRSQIKTWQEVKKTLNWIKEGGKQDVNLAQFIYADRKSR